MLQVKFEQNINDITEERADRGNVNTTAVSETLYVQPEELHKSAHIGINWDSEEAVTQRGKVPRTKSLWQTLRMEGALRGST